MYQKILSFVVISVLTTSAFAQVENNLSTSVEEEPKKIYQKGFSVGFEYMNISDTYAHITQESPGRKRTETSSGGTHLGIAGIRLGYTQIPEKGLGGNAGLSFLQSFNKSEYGDEKLEFLMPQASVHYAFNRFLTVFWGGNVTFITSDIDDSILPDIGMQAGFGGRISRNLALNAGYTVMRLRIDEEDRGTKTTGNIHLSGFNSNLTYTF